MKKLITFLFTIVLICMPTLVQAGTFTAASCSQADVNTIIAGPSHVAVDGDVIVIPNCSASWTTGVTVPSNIGITITGTGTPSSSTSTFLPSASCSSSTNITLNGITAFSAAPQYGNSTMRISCMTLTGGTSLNTAFAILGTCTSSGCPNIRIDNITFPSWRGNTGTTNTANHYGISLVGDVFGVMDHNSVLGTRSFLQLVEVNHASYLGVGLYGDNSWAQSENWGSANFLFIENNTFDIAGATENENTPGVYPDNQGGSRAVIRFNHFTDMDNDNFAAGWHGTESSNRPRSGRAFEFYGNTYTCTGEPSNNCNSVMSQRGGNSYIWGNTFTYTGVGLNNAFALLSYRSHGDANWGACDGASTYDTNDGVTYATGTISNVSGSNPLFTLTITQTGGSPTQPWTTDIWAPAGAPYSIHDLTQSGAKSIGGEILSNGTTTIVVNADPGTTAAWVPAVNDSIQFLRVSACIDTAGRGAGFLYTGNQNGNNLNPATPIQSSAQVLSPSLAWSNTFTPAFGVPMYSDATFTGSGHIIRSRDFYTEDSNQVIQSSATTPFDGTTSKGIGHGTRTNRPTSCTTGVSYFSSDQGSWNTSSNGFGSGVLDTCTSTNTWTSATYTPYTYPHPLDSSPASNTTNAIILQADINTPNNE